MPIRITRGKALIGRGGVSVIAQGSFTHTAGTVADGAGTTYSGAVSGVALGDYVQVASVQSLGGAIEHGFVNGAGTVGFRIQNETGGTVTWAAGTINYLVTR